MYAYLVIIIPIYIYLVHHSIWHRMKDILASAFSCCHNLFNPIMKLIHQREPVSDGPSLLSNSSSSRPIVVHLSGILVRLCVLMYDQNFITSSKLSVFFFAVFFCSGIN